MRKDSKLANQTYKADSFSNESPHIGQLMLGLLHLVACFLIAIYKTVSAVKEFQHIQTGQQILHFTHCCSLLFRTSFTQLFHSLSHQLRCIDDDQRYKHGRNKQRPMHLSQCDYARNNLCGNRDNSVKGIPCKSRYLIYIIGKPGQIFSALL